MELLVLGPVEAVVEGRPLQLGARKQRAVLAMLVLEANRPVSADRLIEGLWGESPPESASKMVQLYISQLRKALRGQDVTITTRARGYQLSCASESVDVVRAERLVAAAGADGAVNGHARAALALWRGPALADVADEPFAAAEIRRCDELWLQAKELAIDSDLAAGRTEDALREAMALAAEHPLREHVQAQLILALYRAGRQADALEAFRAARARLVEEIGSEPGPELRRLHEAILHQSPELDAPARVRAAPGRAPARPPGRRMAIVAAAILACAGILAVVVSPWAGDEADTAIVENSVALIDPASGAVEADEEVGRGPTAVATGAGSVWVANGLDGTVTRIDRSRNQKLPIDVRARPVALAFGAGSVWVAADDQTVVQIAPASNTVVQRIPVGGQPSAVAVGYGSVWVAEPRDGVVARIDLARRRDTQRLPAGAGPSALAAGAGAVWVAAADSGELVRLEPRSGNATASINVGNGPGGVAVGAGAVWVANRTDGTISRVDPRAEAVTGTFKVGADATAIAVTGGDVWAADAAGGTIARVEPGTGRVTRTRVGSSPSALAAGDGALWATAGAAPANHGGGRLFVESSFCQADCMDPAGGYAQAWETLALVYDGLLGYPRLPGAAGEALVGTLATSVPKPTDGGRTYVFTLRPGIRFSTGQPVRAADVRASIERAVWMSRETLPGWFANIVGAERCVRCDLSRGIQTDERARTVTFRLRRPEPVFPFKLASVTASVVPAGTPAVPTLPAPPGTGPYQFASLDEHGYTRLTRNPLFRPWSAATRPGGFVDEIVVRRRKDARRGLAAVEHGASDLAALDYGGPNLSAAERSGIVTRYPSRVAVAPLLATKFMFLNVHEPPFDDVHVRQALNFAADRSRAVELSGGAEAAQPACTAVPPSIPGTRPYCPYTTAPSAAGTWNAPDLSRARRLIAASGTRGMAVRVWTNPTNLRLGRYFAGLLHRLGYRTSLRVVTTGLDYFHAAGHPRAHAQIGWSGWLADYPTPATFFDPNFSCAGLVPEGSLNLSQFCSPSLDRKVAAALEAEGPAAEDAWAAATRQLSGLAPHVPLVTNQRSYFTSARIGNVQQSALFGVMLERAWVR